MSNKDIITAIAIQFWTSSVPTILPKNKMHVDLQSDMSRLRRKIKRLAHYVYRVPF